ncbi:MAG: hypothetical protein C4K60_12955 [Ideonella sp. MAG2]|nr:MAG: hypothetical protein C4K60_12955 [Ideonella sp. MAG2]
MTEEQINLVADIPGLVAIFGDALYKDFGSIVRELVQNSHDTIIEIAAASQHPEEALREYRVDVDFDRARQRLTVCDDGKGMDRVTILDSLNNFAKSRKRDLQKNLNSSARSDSAQALMRIVGEYGVGFLSAMAVSDKLRVWSHRDGATPVLWEYNAGKATAHVTDIERSQFEAMLSRLRLRPIRSGTVVECQLKDSIFEQYWISEEDVGTSLTQYAGLLPVPINYNGEAVSCKYSAWSNPAAATEEEWLDAIRGMHKEEPMLVVPIYSPPRELDIQGVLWIPERTSYFTTPRLDVYVKRMFVVADDEIIVPTWARFVSGMLNGNKLRRIVSGNTIQNDKNATAIREYLKDRIIDEFKKLRSKPERDYWKVVSPHDEAIKGSAADDDEFRACVWDKLRFVCGDRRLTIPEYLTALERKTEKKNTIYFYDQKKQQHSADLVGEATGIPILDIDQTRDDMLVRKICADKDYELRSFRELAEEHFQKPAKEEDFSSLVAACAHWNIEAEVRDYSPAHLPAVMIEDQTFQDRRDQLLQGLNKHGDEHFAKDLEKLFRRQHAANFGVSFYLNSSNPLIQELARANFADQLQICLALYNTSFMAAVPNLKDAERKTIYESISTVYLSALSKATSERRTSSETKKDESKPHEKQRPAQTDGVITVFMITPFSDTYRKLEAAVRSVFEAPPYYFKVVLARDHTFHNSLIGNVKSHIARADAYVAEISDLNPNVMLELGAVLLTGSERPIFSLRDVNAKSDVPADLKSELYLQYGTIEDAEDTIAGRIRSLIERDGRPTHDGITTLLAKRQRRALTRTCMAKLSYRLGEDELSAVLRSYSTVEALQQATREQVIQTTGLKSYAVEALRGELLEADKR